MNKPHHPPAWADRLLEWFCAPHLLEEVQGDLCELYRKWVEKHGVRRARWLYVIHALKFFRPYSIKKLSFKNPTIMFKNYSIIALRTLLKQKLYSLINIGGLALGLACCLLIFLYIRDELTFDHFHDQGDRIYRVYKARYQPSGTIEAGSAWLPIPLGPAMKTDLPEIEEFVRFRRLEYFVRSVDMEAQEEILFADTPLFEVFTFPLIKGDPKTALTNPNSVVLTESMALKYFGDNDPMGQQFSIRVTDQYEDFMVTGVAKDPPGNSSIHFSILAPFSKLMMLEPTAVENWDWNGFFTYVLLQENTSVADLEKKLIPFWSKYYAGKLQKLRDEGRWTGEGLPEMFQLQPLRDLHLNMQINGEPSPSNPLYSYILGSIALFVLVIACINFMMLTLGRSVSRAREIGVRKVVGALRTQLMLQLWGEALFLSILGLAAGLGLARLFLPIFNHLADKMLQFEGIGSMEVLIALFAIAIMTALLAGGYPAFVLSKLHPIETLKSRFRLNSSRGLPHALVVVQFTLSIGMIICTLIMLSQLRYIRTKDLGFDKEQVVIIPAQEMDGERVLRLFQSELDPRSDISGVTGINNTFGHGYSEWGFLHQGEEKHVHVYRGESNFLKVLGIELVAGRNFDPNRSSDSTEAVIINQTMAREFGWTDPIGKIVSGLHPDKPSLDPTVIGVVKDFNFRPLHRSVEPMMLSLSMAPINHLLIRIQPGNMSEALAALRTTWEKVASDVPFTYHFLDEDLDSQYAAEERWSRIVGYGSFFTILVACLGLFGLVTLAAQQRTKEIGIRKVLGASVSSIVTLLSKDFIYLVALAFLLAAPLAWYGMKSWLQDFAYRISIEWWMFVLAGVSVLSIALLTISFQSIKAALTNPVNTLRNE